MGAGVHEQLDLVGSAHPEADAHEVLLAAERLAELAQPLLRLLGDELPARAERRRLQVDDGPIDRARRERGQVLLEVEEDDGLDPARLRPLAERELLGHRVLRQQVGVDVGGLERVEEVVGVDAVERRGVGERDDRVVGQRAARRGELERRGDPAQVLRGPLRRLLDERPVERGGWAGHADFERVEPGIEAGAGRGRECGRIRESRGQEAHEHAAPLRLELLEPAPQSGGHRSPLNAIF